MDLGSIRAALGFRLVTADLPRLLGFYRDVLGLVPEGGTQPIPAEEMERLGLRGRGERVVLHVGAQHVALERFEHAGRPYPEDGDATSTLFQHLALVVADMPAAYARLRDAVPISEGGPQRLPAASGGVEAFKFRDPDGHPLELLRFPPGHAPAAWRDRAPQHGAVLLGIDHSAISVRDTEASVAFYASMGLTRAEGTLNQGPEQDRLDGLRHAHVAVTPLRPAQAPPHLELLCYRSPGTAEAPAPNDVAATRVAWLGAVDALVRDPDGHLHEVNVG